jgi:hypothetical protein
MRFETISQGMVYETAEGTATAVAAMSRCAVAPDGTVACTWAAQSALAVNDFKPMIAWSDDGGQTWRDHRFIWPHLHDTYSLAGSVSGSPAGNLFFLGERTPIDMPGESFWSDVTQGLKQNEIFWARSQDGGRTWSEPTVVPMPIPGSAEIPCAMQVTHGGRWAFCYSPYNTFDPAVVVDRNQVVFMASDDEGRTWRHTSMLRFEDQMQTAAEAWVIELADGRLLGACWHLNQRDGSDFPNAYALSLDGGHTWTATRSSGIRGQSCALTPLPDGRALFVYNQRRQEPVGIGLAVVNPTETDFGVEANEIVWRAETASRDASAVGHSDWTSFAFGEPHVTLLPDGTLLLAYWCQQPGARGIAYARLRMRE